MRFKILALALASHLILSPLISQDMDEKKSIDIDLKKPQYADGVWSTSSGGVISNEDMRVQAKNIYYTLKKNPKIQTLYAEGNVLLTWQGHSFTAEKIEYDFLRKEGKLTNARGAVPPWYVTAHTIQLKNKQTIGVKNANLTTCAHVNSEWSISSRNMEILKNGQIVARNVWVHFFSLPLFWMPSCSLNTHTLSDVPIRYSLRLGGTQIMQASMRYRFWASLQQELALRIDWRLKKGLGAALESQHESSDGLEHFKTNNYIAKDNSTTDERHQLRHRIEGYYQRSFSDGKTLLMASYDHLSDKDMPQDYNEGQFNLKTEEKTQVALRRQDENFLTNFYSRLRINSFETIKQELPTVMWSSKPWNLANTGILSYTSLKASYLYFVFSKESKRLSRLQNTPLEDFDSLRGVFKQRFTRSFHLFPLHFTPELGLTGLYYNKTQRDHSSFAANAYAGYLLNMHLYANGESWRHQLTPFVSQYTFSKPSTNINDHPVFDMDDFLNEFHILSFGIQNHIYNLSYQNFRRILFAEISANAFINTPTVSQKIPKVFTHIVWDPTENIRSKLSMSYHTQRKYLDFLNLSLENTLSKKLAYALEFRHRKRTHWRKVDHSLFLLESLKTEEELLQTHLSDRHDTLLARAFCNLTPNCSLQGESRWSFRRKETPKAFHEYALSLISKFQCNWMLKISYEKTIADRHRYAFSLDLIDGKPTSYAKKVKMR